MDLSVFEKMEKDIRAQYDKLKKDYLQMEREHLEEKECLLKVIQAFGTVVAMHSEMVEELASIKGLVTSGTPLRIDLVEEGVVKLKDKIVARETEPEPEETHVRELKELYERLVQLCRMMKKVMAPLLEGFYPLSEELEKAARSIDIRCAEETAESELSSATAAFLGFVEALKDKISKDFKFINSSFLSLLERIKELEGMLRKEFGGEERFQEIEYFEMKVSHEVGSIINSFDIYTTISEIKNVVIAKIENIKEIVSQRKEEEERKARSIQENVKRLTSRITEVEMAAKKMSERAEHLEEEASKDGLTGLNNRRAFDAKIRETLNAFAQGGAAFSVILFDVDRFKSINDTLGHVAGDKVLKKVAQCLQETFRRSDFAARYGGDEFVVVIEGLTKEMARERILAFRTNLKKRRFTSHKIGEVDVTVSAGIALALQGDTPETLLERADKAMYNAKQKKG